MVPGQQGHAGGGGAQGGLADYCPTFLVCEVMFIWSLRVDDFTAIKTKEN